MLFESDSLVTLMPTMMVAAIYASVAISPHFVGDDFARDMEGAERPFLSHQSVLAHGTDVICIAHHHFSTLGRIIGARIEGVTLVMPTLGQIMKKGHSEVSGPRLASGQERSR
jgi:hypothetical protein